MTADPLSAGGPSVGLPFSGFTILEFGFMVAGPAAGQIMADLGADVIKVEAIDGDVMRGIPPFRNGCSGAFVQWNRNKRSILLDLRSEEGRGIAHRLARRADVLYENYRPGVLAEMGLGYDTLSAQNPGLVYVSINGYGDSGPYSDQPAYDLAVQGLAGFMPRQGENGPPEPIRSVVVDKITAYSAAMAIMSALMYRERNGGVGQKVSVSMLDAFSAFILAEQMYDYAFPETGRPKETVNNLYQPLKVADGYVIGLVGRDSHFEGFMAALNRRDLANDPRFKDTASRFMYTKDLMRAVQAQALGMTKAEFLTLMRKHRVPFGPVNDLDDFFEDPQVRHNQCYVEGLDPDVGIVRTLNSFARFEKSAARTLGRAPKIGENTTSILSDLGFSEPEVAVLRKRGIVR